MQKRNEFFYSVILKMQRFLACSSVPPPTPPKQLLKRASGVSYRWVAGMGSRSKSAELELLAKEVSDLRRQLQEQKSDLILRILIHLKSGFVKKSKPSRPRKLFPTYLRIWELLKYLLPHGTRE